MKRLVALLAVAAGFVVAADNAQAAHRRVVVHPFRYVPYYWGGFNWGYNFNYNFDAGDVIRAQGERTLLNSQAVINARRADRLRMENKLRETQIRNQRRRMARAEINAQNQKRSEMFRRQREATKKAQQRGLTPAEYDATTGAINWPAALRLEEFAEARKILDKMFAAAALDDVTLGRLQVYTVTNSMERQLKAYVRDMPPTAYMEAKNFLGRLYAQSQMPG